MIYLFILKFAQLHVGITRTNKKIKKIPKNINQAKNKNFK